MTDTMVDSPEPVYSQAEVDISTTEPSIEDDTGIDMDIVPRTNTAAPPASIETGDSRIDAAETNDIDVTGVDDLDAFAAIWPRRLRSLNGKVVVEAGLGLRNGSGTHDLLEVPLPTWS